MDDSSDVPAWSATLGLAFRPNVKAMSRVVQGQVKLNERIAPPVKRTITSSKRGRGESNIGGTQLSAEEVEDIAREADRRKRKRLLDAQIANAHTDAPVIPEAGGNKKLGAPNRLFSQALARLTSAPLNATAAVSNGAGPALSFQAPAESAEEDKPQRGKATKAKPTVRGKGRTKAPV